MSRGKATQSQGRSSPKSRKEFKVEEGAQSKEKASDLGKSSLLRKELLFISAPKFVNMTCVSVFLNWESSLGCELTWDF